MYLNVNKAYSSFNSNLAKEEKNDCFVRAFATATGSSYDTAHEFVKTEFNRKFKKGTESSVILAQMLNYEENGLTIDNTTYNVSVLGTSHTKNKYKLHGEIIWRNKTLKSFVASHPKGTYIVSVAGHALTVKDGEVLDWSSNAYLPTRKVQRAYKVDRVSQEGKQLSLF